MLRSVDSWHGDQFAFGEAEASANATPTSVAIDHSDGGPTATIPDAHLLFNAHFSRAGADLVLQGDDGQTAVVRYYFASDTHPRLMSPEGATLSADIVDKLAGPQAPGQYAQAGAPAAAQAVGRVAQADSDATIVRNGVAVAAHAGDAILKGDVLQTVSGTIGVTFTDGSTLNLTANTRMVVNEFVYDPRGSQNSQLLDLVQGSLTFISGEIAHNGNMRIGTPVATMGIRGTVGGVTTANDGTVHFYVSQSATGAVILDARGTIIANVVQDGPVIVVRPAGPLQVVAEEVSKTPAQLAIELDALQKILNIKAIGDAILQQNQQPDPNAPPNPNPQSNDKPLTHIQLFPDLNKVGQNGDTTNNGGDQTYTSATVTYTTTNSDGSQTTHTEDVPLTHVNGAPVATPIVLTVSEDSAPLTINGLDGAHDPDQGDTLHVDLATVVLSSSDGHGHPLPHAVIYSMNGSAVTIDPAQFNYLAAGETAVLTATYDVVDSSGARVSTSATVTVTGVNDAPVLDYFNLNVAEGGVTVLSSSDFHVTDPDSSHFVFTVQNVTGGHFVVAGNTNLYALALDTSPTVTFTSEDIAAGRVRFVSDGGDTPPTFTITVSDGEGGTSEPVSATVIFAPVNDAPVITSNGGGTAATLFVPENTTAVTTVHATDSDSPHVTYSIVGGNDAGKFAINAATGALSFMAAQNYEHPTDSNHNGIYTVQVQASDGSLTDVQTLYVRVTDVNEAPSITSNGGHSTASVTINENHRSVTTVHASDPDYGDHVRYSIVGGADAAKLTVNAFTGELSFRTAPDYENPTDSNGDNKYVVTVQASDGSLTDTQTLTVTVNDVNEAPVITSDGGHSTASISVNENQRTVTTVHATDPDCGNHVSYSIAGGADAGKFTIDSHTGALSFVTAPDYENPTDANHNNIYTMQVRASDGSLADTQTLSVHVANVNEAPVAHDDTATTTVNALLTVAAASGLLANDTDPDQGDSLTVTQINGVNLNGQQPIALEHGTLTVAADGSYTFQAAQGFNGTQTFSYTVSDGHATDTATATISVEGWSNVLTFDDIAATSETYIPSGYGGFTWSNFYVLNGQNYNPASGYASGTVSSPNVAYNGYGYTASVSGGPFDFVGADFTAAWDNGLHIQVQGYLQGAQIYTQTITVDHSSPTWFAFNFDNIDQLVFTSYGGTDAGLGGSGDHFAMDNFTWGSVAADPIILDLGGPGIVLTSAPVAFDLNADGVKEQIGWTGGEDGILVMDRDHSGAIENGHEVFSAAFGTGGFADALAALAAMDGNADGVLDARDTAFKDIAVWQDTNHDGISQPGELSSLSDHGIVALDLKAQTVSEQNGGQDVVARGHVTLTDGATGDYVAVNFQSAPASPAMAGNETPAQTAAATDAVHTDGHAADAFHFAAATETIGNVAKPDIIQLEGFNTAASFDELLAAADGHSADVPHGDVAIHLGDAQAADGGAPIFALHVDPVYLASGLHV